MPAFTHRLRKIQHAKQTVLAVGLDPDPQRLPEHLTSRYSVAEAVMRFNAAIIEATSPFACAYKLNFAFYEALGASAHEVLQFTRRRLPPDVVSIADAKRGDIGNSARHYAQAMLDQMDFDSCTVAPYMGRDAVTPFLSYEGKAAFILARTSNAGGSDFQERDCEGEKLYERVARHVARWDEDAPGTAGLVVGATRPEALRGLRALCPSLPFLIPGLGAQGGAAEAVGAARTATGDIIVNSSRSILYAFSGLDFAARASEQAERIRAELAPFVSFMPD